MTSLEADPLEQNGTESSQIIYIEMSAITHSVMRQQPTRSAELWMVVKILQSEWQAVGCRRKLWNRFAH